jgi:hypothetical protein
MLVKVSCGLRSLAKMANSVCRFLRKAKMAVPDYKGLDGRWVRSTGRGKNQIYTRAGNIWRCVQTRCKLDGQYQKDRDTYKGVRNEFIDFQHFAEWCQKQIGYSSDEVWQIDKDLLYKNCKVYSEGTCLFLPIQINNFLIQANMRRGKLPIGVKMEKKVTARYKAQCAPSGTDFKNYIGNFDTPEEAFYAYKTRKECIAKILAERWKDKIDPRAYEALQNFTVNIND